MGDEKNIVSKLIEKSKEAFLVAIELYNKPTIKYRVEGFSFFICNAWELMLKAYIINKYGESEIYYKDNTDRTISLENCIQKAFSNKNAPMRKNIEKICELRNQSTHFITEEYEMVYIPLFQACVFNYIEKLQEFHGIDLTKEISSNYLALSTTSKQLEETEIRTKYPKEIANKLIKAYEKLQPIISDNNSNFAIRIEHDYYITKNINKASATVAIDNNSDAKIKIVKELKDPNQTHSLTMKKAIKEINKRLEQENINIVINSYHFNLFNKRYGIKDNDNYCYAYKVHSNPTYSYSVKVIDFIVDEIRKDPENIIENLKKQKNS